jgi:hypothetical protein
MKELRSKTIGKNTISLRKVDGERTFFIKVNDFIICHNIFSNTLANVFYENIVTAFKKSEKLELI